MLSFPFDGGSRLLPAKTSLASRLPGEKDMFKVGHVVEDVTHAEDVGSGLVLDGVASVAILACVAFLAFEHAIRVRPGCLMPEAKESRSRKD